MGFRGCNARRFALTAAARYCVARRSAISRAPRSRIEAKFPSCAACGLALPCSPPVAGSLRQPSWRMVGCRPKFSQEQKDASVDHYLAHGHCIAATMRALGYPCRETLTAWIREALPDARRATARSLEQSSRTRSLLCSYLFDSAACGWTDTAFATRLRTETSGRAVKHSNNCSAYEKPICSTDFLLK